MLNRFILFSVFFIWSHASLGGEEFSEISELAYKISENRYELAKNNLENAIEICDKKRKTVPPSLISPLGMEMNEIKTALFVLNGRAEEVCEGEARLNFFYVSGIHRQVSKYYGLSPGDAENYTEDLLFSQEWKKLEFEAKYLNINKDTRQKLEAIEELKVPFKIFQTIDGLEKK